MSSLEGKKIALLLANLYDEKEFWYPYFRLKEAGAEVVVVGEKAGEECKGKVGMPARSQKSFAEVKADDFAGVVIPGGFGPDYLRRSQECLKLVRDISEAGKLVAFICHAGWVPISAGILKGRKATSVGAIKDDMVNAGCLWEDKALVSDGNFVSSRTPDDLPEFAKGILAFFDAKK